MQATHSARSPTRSGYRIAWSLTTRPRTEHPPSQLLPTIADALGLTVDQLLGRQALKKKKAPTNERLLRQLRQVENLPPRARQAVLDHIEALVNKYGDRHERQ